MIALRSAHGVPGSTTGQAPGVRRPTRGLTSQPTPNDEDRSQEAAWRAIPLAEFAGFGKKTPGSSGL